MALAFAMSVTAIIFAKYYPRAKWAVTATAGDCGADAADLTPRYRLRDIIAA